MKTVLNLKDHQAWEDWLAAGLGALLLATPWLTGYTGSPTVALNAVAAGMLVVMLAVMEFFDRQRWEELMEFALGGWIIASPFVLGYAGDGALSFWHFGIGAVLIALAVVEYRQPHKTIDA